MSPMTIIGSGDARSRTTSHAPASQTWSIRSSQTARRLGSAERTRPGVNPRLTSLRRLAWADPSMSIIHGSGPVSGRLPPALENVAESRSAARTPA
jgi:hypothetical protein